MLDHELAYIALRDASPRWVQALMAPDAMTIPGRQSDDGDPGVARPAQTGPVFSVDPLGRTLHMRYTARTRSIEWKDDAATLKAVAFLERYLREDNPDVLQLRLEPGGEGKHVFSHTRGLRALCIEQDAMFHGVLP